MKLHDSERRDDHREAHRSSTDRCATAFAATGERGKEACYAPLPGAETVPASLRASEPGHSSYQLAQSLGFKGDYRAWEHLLRVHE
jgi:hypothetical protein